MLSGFHKDEVPVIDDVLSHVDEWLSFWLQEGIVATNEQIQLSTDIRQAAFAAACFCVQRREWQGRDQN